ncbi:hypothetical protein, partial [Bacillus cereus group sp. BC307]|uniref:hypothetical protein n=1 Tax=Bacillus cereus group sp. BC307 TaxID=3445319 RepID=UPI003F228085
WQPVVNDIRTLLAAGRLDVYGDSTFKGSREAAKRPVASQFGGDIERKVFPAARDNYAQALLEATGPWKVGEKDEKGQLNIAAFA